ncbi:hypothetical protein [Methanosarcina barkeri]|uniref:Uncharacterized protein n=1 Tax=Methanosarcina barkeri (strain Fusaro / DSM 804) TaxID=269797 RepID=Q468I0_METBF|nr:hypothetical protein [Methanosarcina barkeri]
MAVELAGGLEINRDSDIVLASSDVVANDTVGLALLKTFDTIPKIQKLSSGLSLRSKER